MGTKVIYIRDWNRSDPEHVYIGRAGKGLLGPFGNPVVRGRSCPVCRRVHRDGGETLPCYEAWLQDRLSSDAVFRAAVAGLADKTLVCFCAPRACHGDVLARYANQLAK